MSFGSPRTIRPGAIVVFGGRSEIGMDVAVRLAAGRSVVLAARRCGELDDQVSRLVSAGATAVDTVEFDAKSTTSHADLMDTISETHGPLSVVVLAFGILGDQHRAEHDPQHAVDIVNTDFVAQISVLTSAASVLRRQKSGSLVVFSSVAGVRVRRANYVYGSAKAGLDGFASGLGDALHGSGVQLLLVRPGFVVGSMTHGMTPAPFASDAATVADAVVRGLRTGADRVWVPRVLAPIFFALHFVPKSLWRRMPR